MDEEFKKVNPFNPPITMVADPGLPLRQVVDVAAMAHPFRGVTHWKLTWGSAKLDEDLTRAKLSLMRQRGIACFPGGTLSEIQRWNVGQTKYGAVFDEYASWLRSVSFEWVEVSDGTLWMPLEQRVEVVDQLASAGLKVIAEVGHKNPNVDPMPPTTWRQEAMALLGAGAVYVVYEGRMSGDVGLYRRDHSLRSEAENFDVSDGDRIIWEAPRSSQQADLVRDLGPNVNLGNVRPNDIVGLACLRRGLRPENLDPSL